MYWKDVYHLGRVNEVEIKAPMNYGAKGQARQPRAKPTPEQMAKQNEWNRRTYVRRLILLNFKEHDLWCTLKYPAGTRFTELKEVTKDVRKFLNSIRGKFKRRGYELKYIYRIEIGKRGGVHIHILMNRVQDADIMIQESWKQGRVHFESMTEQGGVEQLAAYVTKKQVEVEKQLSLFEDEDRKKLLTYQPSRNLTKPERIRKRYKNRKVNRLVKDGPKASKGYYIDKDSIVTGTNPFTGLIFYRYTEIQIEPRGPAG